MKINIHYFIRTLTAAMASDNHGLIVIGYGESR